MEMEGGRTDDSDYGPLRKAFISEDRFGGFSKGDVIAWSLALLLWVAISGGVFDDDSWTDLWISSIVGVVCIFTILYPSFVIHNWANEKPLLSGNLLESGSMVELLHLSNSREPEMVKWDKKRSIVILIISVIVWIVGPEFILAEIAIAFGAGVDFSYEVVLAISSIAYSILFLVLIERSMKGGHVSSLFKINDPWMKIAWLVLIVMSVDLFIESTLFALGELSADALGIEIEEESYWYDQDSADNLVIYSFAAINLIILGPIMEEIIFRGYVLDTFRGFFTEKVAVISSSLLFGMLHFMYGGLGIILISFGGALYAWLRIRTGSLVPPIICHIMWNLIQILSFGIA